MKSVKIILAIVIVLAGAYLAWSLLGTKKVSETKINEEFQVEVQRFEQLEGTELPITPDVEEKIAEGRSIINNRMAVTETKVTELRNVNDTIEAALKVVDYSANVMDEYETLTVKFDELKVKDYSKLSDEKKAKAEDLIAKGEGIINNRMAISEPKNEQLRKIVEQLEKIHVA